MGLYNMFIIMMVGILFCWEVIHGLKPAQMPDEEHYHVSEVDSLFQC